MSNIQQQKVNQQQNQAANVLQEKKQDINKNFVISSAEFEQGFTSYNFQDNEAQDFYHFKNQNEIINRLPVLREMLIKSEIFNPNKITQDDILKILKKFKITNDINEAKKIFTRIDYRKVNEVQFEDLALYFCQDIRRINLISCSQIELILLLGITMFRVFSSEKMSLELKDILRYVKLHKDLELDFLQVLEIFEFYDNLHQGVLKKKISITQFFAQISQKLGRTLKPQFIYQLQEILSNNDKNANGKLGFNSQRGSTDYTLKLYDNDEDHRGQQRKIPEKSDLQGLIQKNFNLPFEVQVEIAEQKIENDIEEYFENNRPRNKGWLCRNSKKHKSKWQNIFFYISGDGTHLISVKPTKLKLEKIELYLCSFFDILDSKLKVMNINNGNAGKGNGKDQQQINKKSNHKRNNSIGISFKRIDNKDESEDQQDAKHFFVVDTSISKTYLISSQDSLTITSMICYFLNKIRGNINYFKENNMLHYYQGFDPEYTGIIQIAQCKKGSIGVQHSDLKQYSFQPCYLIIKNGKFMIYDMQEKDRIDLSKYEVKTDKQIPSTPNCPYSLALVEVGGFQLESLPENDEKVNENSVVVFNTLQSEENILQVQKNQNQFIGHDKIVKKAQGQQQQQIQQNHTTEPQKKTFFQKLIEKFTKKKQDKLILGADSEYKKNQWIFALNYFKTIILKQKNKYNKSSVQKIGSTDQTKNSIVSIPKHKKNAASLNIQYQTDNATNNNNNNNVIQLTSGNVANKDNNKKSFQGKLNDIDDKQDYYNVFQNTNNDGGIVMEVRDEESDQSPQSQKQINFQQAQPQPQSQTQQHPQQINFQKVAEQKLDKIEQKILNEMIEKENQGKNDTEEAVLTLPNQYAEAMMNRQALSHQRNVCLLQQKEIKTYTEEELWQKFIKHFLSKEHKYIECQLHSCKEQEVNEEEFSEITTYECTYDDEEEPQASTVLYRPTEVRKTKM